MWDLSNVLVAILRHLFSEDNLMSGMGFSTNASEPFTSKNRLQGKSILIVDDDPTFRRLTRACLESQGCEVDEAENGLEGLIKLKQETLDLVLCDLSMPVLTGIEFVEEISQSYPSLPMLVVSATDEMSEVAQALKFGIKDFVAKPIRDYQQLLTTITHIVEYSDNHTTEGRDFASQWFRVDGGEIPEEEELHCHLKYLESHPSAARNLLQAIMPAHDTVQGDWRFGYRLLQSAEAMPLVFDYAWLMEGQFVFYIVDSGSDSVDGVGATLLVRALFHDYIRTPKTRYADLKDLAEIVEHGVSCSDCSGAVSALFGIADTVNSTLSIFPAGLNGYWKSPYGDINLDGGNKLGNKCMRNFITKDLPIGQKSQLMVSNVGVCSFTLDIMKHVTI
jgi:CheY-like chemotaxis protein